MIRLLMIFALFQTPVHYVSDAHVIVYHAGNISNTTARTYLTLLSKMYSTETGKFGVRSDVRLRVRLCGDSYEFSDLTGKDSSFSPLWKNNELYIIQRENSESPDYSAALEAGVIRAILERFHLNGAPLWLIGAAAAYESGEFKECTAPPIESVRYFSDLDEKILAASSDDDLADLCFYLGNTGKFFDMKFGVGSFVKLVREFGKATTFNVAATKLFHISAHHLESEWRDFLSKQIKGG